MDQTLDHYRLDGEIGRGATGVVYRAYDLVLHRPVAIKMLAGSMDATARADLVAEARVAAALSHPNICVVHAVHDEGDKTYLVTELIEGQPLSALIPARGLPPVSAARYGLQIADALAHAHARRLVHRDVKPANVIVTATGLAKLVDFGIARRMARGDWEAARTTTRTGPVEEPGIAGTPAYMAPEVLRGHPADSASDVWSMGITLYEMAAGRRPFGGDTFIDLAGAILHQPLPPLPAGVPPGLAAVIHRCLERVPERRLRTGAEAHAALATLDPAGRIAAEVGATATPSVAVLPFADMSPARDHGYLCEGIAEEIINALSRHPEFRVVARTSSFAVSARDPGADIREIAHRLSVATVVEGSVRKAGNLVRVTAQLVDAGTGYSIWSDNFDSPLQDVFAVYDRIATAVATSFERAIPATPPDAQTAGAVTSPEAYELYLQGRYLWNRRPGDVVWRALDCFERAVDIDPRFAPALAGIADVYATLGSWESGVLPHAEAQAKAREYSQRALAIAPQLAEAHTTLAYTALHYDWDVDAAEEGFERALRLNPGYAPAHHWYSHCLIAAGRVDESLRQSRLALQSDPMNLVLNVHLAWHHHMARQPEQVIQQADRVVHMDRAFHWGHYFMGWGLEGAGDAPRAVEAFREAARSSAEDPVMRAGLGRALAVNGDAAEARRIAAELQKAGGDRGLFAYEIALIHLALGERDEAFEWLERARRERSGWIPYVDADPRLDALRTDPRFRAVTGRA